MLDLRQPLYSDPLVDPGAALEEGVARARVLARIKKPSSRVAVAVGSRRIDGLPVVVGRLFDLLRAEGHRPFMIPAMGSHGGATARGQERILHDLGVAGDREVDSSMETVFMGRTPGGAEVLTARAALEADAVVLVNRVSPHTGYTGEVQSGLVKMLAVGLGKERGAAALHAHGFGAGALLGEAADLLLERLNVVAGVAMVEDGFNALSRLEVLPGSSMRSREPELLDLAFRMFPRIPVSPVDLLIVDEMGKEICGTGMHPLVTGRGKRHEPRAEPVFECRRLVVLTLTSTDGNATGVGFADVTTTRLVRAMDETITRRNVLTSGALERARVPAVATDDRQAICSALESLGSPSADRARVVRIKNTSELSEIKVSTALAEEIRGRDGLLLSGEAREMSFDPAGTIL